MAARKGKVVCAMSGGVDSSVAAALLKEEGYEVVGVFMRLGSPKGVEIAETCDTSGKKHKQGCCSVNDAGDARRVAGILDIPFYVVNFEEDFGRVIEYFVGEYNAGRTPNPCVRCNDWLKFGKLAAYAKAVGADYVASGHYARVGEVGGEKVLMRGLDHSKDQSYVLFGMGREAMSHTLLPIGGYEKTEVRRMAEERGLPVFSKPDSQEICFVPDQDYAGLVKRRSPDTFRGGEVVTTEGEVVGTHDGYQQFTIGQRKGLGIAMGERRFVVSIDPATAKVTVGPRERLFKQRLWAGQGNFLVGGMAVGTERKIEAKIRYNHSPQPGTLRVTGERELEVVFDEPQSAITPGQAVVCYDGEVVVAGGWIEGAD